MPGNPDWKREEIILAMDLYIQAGGLDGSVPGQGGEEVTRLSGLLNRLSAYPLEERGDRYRNPAGVYMKLMNLRHVHTDGAHGMRGGSRRDAAVWREFVDNLPGLRTEAQAIRARVQDGSLLPAVAATVSEDVDIEQQHTESFTVTPSGEPRVAERAEQQLVMRYRDYMARKGVLVRRRRYRPAGEVRPIYSDIWVEDRRALIEAKNSDGRDVVRLAIGQLYDYRRFHEEPVHIAVLFPFKPGADRLGLLRSAGAEAVWEHKNGFSDSARGLFD
jgi:hypothetical protein